MSRNSQEESPPSSGSAREVTTLGGGCFWCIEAIFSQLKGVEKAESGYSGGDVAYPTYEDVCSDTTGHAEVVQITFDPSIIPYPRILEVFFGVHDPTTLNRQGNDVGTQYRSVIFYHNEAQKNAAEKLIHAIDEAKIWKRPLVTEVVPFKEFFRAEDYHQDYFRRNQWQPYCLAVIRPEVSKFKKEFPQLLKNAGV